MFDSVAVLLHRQPILLEAVDQDGMRARVHAGSSSFRKAESLQTALAEATDHAQLLKREHQVHPSGDDRRGRASRQRAANERQQRIVQAHEELKHINEQRQQRVTAATQHPRDEPDREPARTSPKISRHRPAPGTLPTKNHNFAAKGDKSPADLATI